MNLTLAKGWLFALLIVSSFACKDDYQYSELVRDNRPAVPVTFPGTTTFGFNPFVLTSLSAGGAIKFTLSIPASSGRTIKEITKVAAGATGINVATLNNSPGYNSAPIAASGTTVDFTTTIAEFKAKRPTVSTAVAALPNYNELQFIFLITLDDGTQIVTEPVRARIVA